MNLDGLNRWLTLGANLGILAGLLLVVVQLNQSAAYQDVEQTNAEFALREELVLASIGEALPAAMARARLNVADLRPEETTLIEVWLRARFFLETLDLIQESRGVGRGIQDALPMQASSVREFVDSNLGNETALRWWVGFAPIASQLMPEFAAAVEIEIARRGPGLRSLDQGRAQTMIDGPLPEGVQSEAT